MKKSPRTSAMRSSKIALLVGGLCLTLTGCMSIQRTAFPIGSVGYPPKPADAPVAVFKDAAPTRAFVEVARLNVHIEKTFLIPTAFSEALPKLEILARQMGADALTDIVEKKSRLNETFIYNVSATGIVFTD